MQTGSQHSYLFILIKLSSIVLLGRYDDQFVVAAFDNAPTADSEIYPKLDKSVRDVCESRVRYVAKMHVFFIDNSIFFSCFMKFKSQEKYGARYLSNTIDCMKRNCIVTVTVCNFLCITCLVNFIV